MEKMNYTELDWRWAIVLGVALREFVGGISEDAALFAVNMLVLTAGGGTYTREEYEGWLTGAGFDGVEVVPVPGRGTHLIFARNPG